MFTIVIYSNEYGIDNVISSKDKGWLKAEAKSQVRELKALGLSAKQKSFDSGVKADIWIDNY
jgi:hypothetical protein